MPDETKKYLILSWGIILAIITVLFFAHDTSRIYNWSKGGFIYSSHRPAKFPPDGLIIFNAVDPSDFIGEQVPVEGDTIVSIAGIPATSDVWIDSLEIPKPPGREIEVVYKHVGTTLTSTIKTRPVGNSLLFSLIALIGIRFLIVTGFFGIGAWAIQKRPNSIGVRSLVLFSFTITPVITMIWMPVFSEVASFQVPFRTVLELTLRISAVFFSSFWFLMNMVFPSPDDFYKRHPWITYSIAFVPQIVCLIWIILPTPDYLPRLFFAISAVVQLSAGLYILGDNYRKPANKLEKRQTRLVLFGSGPAIVILSYYVFEFHGMSLLGVFEPFGLFTRLLITNIIFLIFLIVPITFAYALGKYRLLEVEGKLRRSTRYVITTTIIAILFIGIIYAVGELLMQGIGITSRTPTMLIAFGLALGFIPAQRKLQTEMEKIFYPERRKLRGMVHEFFQSASGLPDTDSLCEKIDEWMNESLRIENVHAIIRGKINGGEVVEANREVLFSEDGELFVCLRDNRFPLPMDEAEASSKICYSDAEHDWLEEREVALIMPLIAHDNVLGFIALGYKPDEEDFHPEELQILKTFSDQVALSLENIQLLEDSVEKRRMEEELNIARRVQQKFLPQVTPDTPGLDIAASSTFSLEVAGDYYDIIPLENDVTLLAIGDVSGKGAGAALIMANLQASLRSLCGVNLPLSEMVARMNDLIFQNTESDQYITFFVGLFDSQTKELTYVNAGHNPPMHQSKDGTLSLLEEGGLMLGAFKGMSYCQGSVKLETGDLLLLYTDGLSESMDENEEEFGEEKIEDILREYSGKNVQFIMDEFTRIESEFRGDSPPSDDMTILLTRVN